MIIKKLKKINDVYKILFIFSFTNVFIIFSAPFSFPYLGQGIVTIMIPIINSFTVIFITPYIMLTAYERIDILFKDKIIVLISFILTMLHTLIYSYAIVAANYGLVTEGKLNTTIKAYDAYYFSIVTLTTLGYGDYSPTHEMKLVFAFEALTGYIFFAMTFGLFISLLLKRQNISTKHKKIKQRPLARNMISDIKS